MFCGGEQRVVLDVLAGLLSLRDCGEREERFRGVRVRLRPVFMEEGIQSRDRRRSNLVVAYRGSDRAQGDRASHSCRRSCEVTARYGRTMPVTGRYGATGGRVVSRRRIGRGVHPRRRGNVNGGRRGRGGFAAVPVGGEEGALSARENARAIGIPGGVLRHAPDRVGDSCAETAVPLSSQGAQKQKRLKSMRRGSMVQLPSCD